MTEKLMGCLFPEKTVEKPDREPDESFDSETGISLNFWIYDDYALLGPDENNVVKLSHEKLIRLHELVEKAIYGQGEGNESIGLTYEGKTNRLMVYRLEE